VSHVVLLWRIELTLSLHTVIDDGMIPFATYTSAQTLDAFQGASPPKLPLSVGRTDNSTPFNTWFFGLKGVGPPKRISIGTVVFAGLTNVTNRQTDRHTDRRPRYPVCNNKPHQLLLQMLSKKLIFMNCSSIRAYIVAPPNEDFKHVKRTGRFFSDKFSTTNIDERSNRR